MARTAEGRARAILCLSVILTLSGAVSAWIAIWPPRGWAWVGPLLALCGGIAGLIVLFAREKRFAEEASEGRVIELSRRAGATERDEGPSRVVVESSERVFDDFFAIDRAVVRNELYNGKMSRARRWLVFERGDAVAVLPYDRERGAVVLVQQFRFPAHLRGDGWLWEVIAGMQDGGRDAESVVRAEAWEEAGYRLDDVRYVTTVYPSAGGSSERVHLYVAPVSAASREGAGGGIEGHEDIRVVEMPLTQALAMVRSGEIMAASAIIALQYLAMNWDSPAGGYR